MKRFLLALATAAALAGTAASFAAPKLDGAVKELNAEIARVLSVFQNNSTQAKLAFSQIKADEKRALAVKLAALYKKTGSQNTLTIKVDELSYNYGNGKTPTTKVRANLGLDITKAISERELKDIIPSVEDLVQDFAKEYARDYGDAAKVVAKVTEKKTDASGSFTSIKAKLSGKIDLRKLPAGKKSEDVMFVDARAELAVDLKKGIAASVILVSNPNYKGFRSDQKGLKETLEKLLARDAQEIKEISDIYRFVDDFAARLVEGRFL